MDIIEKIKTWIKIPIQSISQTRLIVYASLFLFIIVYVVWSIFFAPHQQSTTTFQQPKPAVEAKKEPGPLLTVPIQIVPKKEVIREFPTAQIANDEEFVDTSEIAPTDNGGITLTKVDTVTGEIRTDFKPNEAPWLGFENKNYLGIGVEAGTKGANGNFYYKRDILRMKDLHLQVKPIEIAVPIDQGVSLKELNIKAGANLEYRW
jgi:hypothetical protein